MNRSRWTPIWLAMILALVGLGRSAARTAWGDDVTAAPNSADPVAAATGTGFGGGLPNERLGEIRDDDDDDGDDDDDDGDNRGGRAGHEQAEARSSHGEGDHDDGDHDDGDHDEQQSDSQADSTDGQEHAHDVGSEADDPEMAELERQDQELDSESQQLAEQYWNTDGRDAKEQLRAALTEKVNAHFEIRQRKRELEIQRMEAEIQRLREIVERRNAARNEIVLRRMAELIHEGDDLGF